MTDVVRTNMRDLQKEMTRNRLKEAAVACFVENGYLATAVTDITKTAGATRATFYLHYKTKADVVNALLDELDVAYAQPFAEFATVLAQPTLDGFRTWLTEIIGMWEQTRDISIAVSDAASVEREIGDRRARSFEFETDRIAKALSTSGEWSAKQARIRAVLIFSQLGSLFMQWSARDSDLDAEEAIDVLAAMWMAALDPENFH
ncbi:TetR/AcrR family transcriptional regulator [Rhodococcus sp. T2V]|uniref:TetR/AcrR family transcriptional regulator n=1 Tax=Rhodococcus sp. T2V TaxID=3034164 RepID=UPI0023E129BE|nr:TetR/AcrR family transcriptional regulator [Rhodococcus sp. T2V]MDF3308198.1 TetR/AcrR family transcriptional regulator [Rhodococcus sp. T2V]